MWNLGSEGSVGVWLYLEVVGCGLDVVISNVDDGIGINVVRVDEVS